ncbi:Isochorismatase-like protein [Aspergillus heterothallicus]
MSTTSSSSPFHIPLDPDQTALLLADVQDEILARFPPAQRAAYLERIHSLLTLFRARIAAARQKEKEEQDEEHASSAYARGSAKVPLIIHHVLRYGINANAFVSPYNSPRGNTDPTHPVYSIPAELVPPGEWGSSVSSSSSSPASAYCDEILLPKIQTSSFGSSDLLAYLRARNIRHVVLVGLTVSGAILGSARAGADLDFHTVVPREAVMDDEEDVERFVLERLLPKFVDVVAVGEVVALL